MTILNTTDANSQSDAAFVVMGGLSIYKKMYLGVSLSECVLDTNSQIYTKYTDNLWSLGTVQATSSTTGGLIVNGGVGIAKNLYVGGNENLTGTLTISNTTVSTSTSTGALIVNGGVAISGSVVDFGASSVIYCNNTSDAYINESAVNFGSIISSGGIMATNEMLLSTTQSTSTTSGALTIVGGCGIAKNLNVGGTLMITSTTSATSLTTGSLIVSGGMSVAGAIYSPSIQNISISPPSYSNGQTLTGSDMINGIAILTDISGGSVTLASASDLWTALATVNGRYIGYSFHFLMRCTGGSNTIIIPSGYTPYGGTAGVTRWFNLLIVVNGSATYNIYTTTSS
jgi:hypothetical protein